MFEKSLKNLWKSFENRWKKKYWKKNLWNFFWKIFLIDCAKDKSVHWSVGCGFRSWSLSNSLRILSGKFGLTNCESCLGSRSTYLLICLSASLICGVVCAVPAKKKKIKKNPDFYRDLEEKFPIWYMGSGACAGSPGFFCGGGCGFGKEVKTQNKWKKKYVFINQRDGKIGKSRLSTSKLRTRISSFLPKAPRFSVRVRRNENQLFFIR